jgi:hypothetical protein
MKKILVALLLTAVISCNTADSGRPYKSDIKAFKNPYIKGKITNITWKKIGQDSVYTVLVEENPNVDEPLESGGKKVILSVSKSTEIFILKKDGNTYYGNKEDLKVNQKVRGWLSSGTILTSYPSQAGAQQILAIEE